VPTGRTILDRVRDLVRHRGFESEAAFLKEAKLSPGYLANLEDRIEERRRAGKKLDSVTIQLDAAMKMARVLGVNVETLAGEYVGGSREDAYPERYWAVEAARFVGLPEPAIRSVQADKPPRDLSRQAWFKRIEAAAQELADRSSVVPMLPPKAAEQA